MKRQRVYTDISVRRRQEPTRVDRIIQGGLIFAVVGALCYGVYFVLNFDDFIVPAPLTRHPAEVPPEAVWYGPRGYKDGLWVACAPSGGAGSYSCRTWSRWGQENGAGAFRYVGNGPPPARPVVEEWGRESVLLRDGGRLEYVGSRGP